jgi:hypothetical protein
VVPGPFHPRTWGLTCFQMGVKVKAGPPPPTFYEKGIKRQSHSRVPAYVRQGTKISTNLQNIWKDTK